MIFGTTGTGDYRVRIVGWVNFSLHLGIPLRIFESQKVNAQCISGTRVCQAANSGLFPCSSHHPHAFSTELGAVFIVEHGKDAKADISTWRIAGSTSWTVRAIYVGTAVGLDQRPVLGHRLAVRCLVVEFLLRIHGHTQDLRFASSNPEQPTVGSCNQRPATCVFGPDSVGTAQQIGTGVDGASPSPLVIDNNADFYYINLKFHAQ